VAPTVRQTKQQALQQGCSLNQLLAQFIRLGLHGDPSAGNPFSSELDSRDAADPAATAARLAG
jgi:hypothetical protein